MLINYVTAALINRCVVVEGAVCAAIGQDESEEVTTRPSPTPQTLQARAAEPIRQALLPSRLSS